MLIKSFHIHNQKIKSTCDEAELCSLEDLSIFSACSIIEPGKACRKYLLEKIIGCVNTWN